MANELSIVIIAKNEAKLIGNCIKSIQPIAKEIIVVDDQSSDETAVIAERLGALVYSHAKQNFAEARNFGLKMANGKWLLYIDADERASDELVSEIKQIVSQNKIAYQSYKIRRVNFFLGKQWPTEEKIVRLFFRKSLESWHGNVHESPNVTGEIGDLTGSLIHNTHQNLTDMVQNTIVWSEIEAKLRYDTHHPPVSWWRLPRVIVPTFFDYYIRQGGWKIGTVGLIESMYQAFSIFITYARLWEMQQKEKGNV